MAPHDIYEFLQKRPFTPFRFHTSEGLSYDIRHPEEAMVLSTRVVVAVREDGNAKFADHLEHVALAHIVRVEELPTESSKSA